MVEDFRQKGQSIKMTKIAAGKAPTSMRTSTLSRGAGPAGEEPWTPICITSRLRDSIVCGDAWGNDFVGSGPTGLVLLTPCVVDAGQVQACATRSSRDWVHQLFPLHPTQVNSVTLSCCWCRIVSSLSRCTHVVDGRAKGV